ncbi:dihydrofolate reductase [Saccharicrinis sp. FJH2]|uniref:dihydrofolate reductase n=1 Tax=Saccharicrinis sp. FJH65 TaxID=3344659 RepID=UPI0035F3583C
MYNNLSIIVAITRDFAIGKNNDLLVHIPGDLKRFKEITTGHPVIMGRNTLISLPNGPLKNRRNIVITDNPEESFDGCEMVYSIDEAVEKVKEEDEAFIIGGGMIYRQFYPIAGKLYLTIVDKSYDADVYFPEIHWEDWNEIDRKDFEPGEVAEFGFSYVTLERIASE